MLGYGTCRHVQFPYGVRRSEHPALHLWFRGSEHHLQRSASLHSLLAPPQQRHPVFRLSLHHQHGTHRQPRPLLVCQQHHRHLRRLPDCRPARCRHQHLSHPRPPAQGLGQSHQQLLQPHLHGGCADRPQRRHHLPAGGHHQCGQQRPVGGIHHRPVQLHRYWRVCGPPRPARRMVCLRRRLHPRAGSPLSSHRQYLC